MHAALTALSRAFLISNPLSEIEKQVTRQQLDIILREFKPLQDDLYLAFDPFQAVLPSSFIVIMPEERFCCGECLGMDAPKTLQAYCPWPGEFFDSRCYEQNYGRLISQYRKALIEVGGVRFVLYCPQFEDLLLPDRDDDWDE